MKARFMAPVAIALLLSGSSAYAASTMTPNTPAASATSGLLSTGLTMSSSDAVASKVMGAKVFDGADQNANQIGTINDLVLGQGGNVAAAVIGVGGFLGVGQKNVAVNYDQLTWSTQPDG